MNLAIVIPSICFFIEHLGMLLHHRYSKGGKKRIDTEKIPFCHGFIGFLGVLVSSSWLFAGFLL